MAELYVVRLLHFETKSKKTFRSGVLKIKNGLWENIFELQFAKNKMQINMKFCKYSEGL